MVWPRSWAPTRHSCSMTSSSRDCYNHTFCFEKFPMEGWVAWMNLYRVRGLPSPGPSCCCLLWPRVSCGLWVQRVHRAPREGQDQEAGPQPHRHCAGLLRTLPCAPAIAERRLPAPPGTVALRSVSSQLITARWPSPASTAWLIPSSSTASSTQGARSDVAKALHHLLRLASNKPQEMANASLTLRPRHFQEEQRGQGRGKWLGGSSACPGGPGAAEDAAAGTVNSNPAVEALLLPSNLHSLPFWPSVCNCM